MKYCMYLPINFGLVKTQFPPKTTEHTYICEYIINCDQSLTTYNLSLLNLLIIASRDKIDE